MNEKILRNYLIENYGKNYKLIDHVNGLETNDELITSLVHIYECGDEVMDDYVSILDMLHDMIVMGLIEVEGE